MEGCKFLVAGDVRGNFKVLFSKVKKSINKCGPFAFLLCTGSFFGETPNFSEWDYYKLNPQNIPIQVYILGPNSDNEANFYSTIERTYSINEKITYVGKSGMFTTCEGIKVAYVSGFESLFKNKKLSVTEMDVGNLMSKNITVDIIFSSQWPIGITSNGVTDYEPKCPSQSLSKLIKILKPRYFFSGYENKYFERLPLCHTEKDGTIQLLTRFVGLAFVGNSNEKWFYAVNMDLQRKLSISDANQINLYLKHQPLEEQYNSHITDNGSYIWIQDQPKKKTAQKNVSKTFNLKENCWFCLSSDAPQNHLIISVGFNVYLSLSKGGLVRDHLLLIPINHVSSISQAGEEVRTELSHYKKLIKQHFIKKNKRVIFFERFYKTSHAQVNCVPMREDLSCNVKTSFMERAAEIGLGLSAYSTKDDVLQKNSSGIEYFHVELNHDEELFCEISPQSDFPLNFGREALVKEELFKQSGKKADWKNCVLEFEEEKLIVDKLRKELPFHQ
ncbi:CWF19-like protein 1 isoform X2 [Halyomorpha halys]|uniref:CWF19-like protein 1 isoform X2 n=1 Tax=Halyomorpha halys TaxID=286706 RepID=UPI0006D50707|nr:CWF19-like protein 1 isoform X2 [Halyomorpha halys]